VRLVHLVDASDCWGLHIRWTGLFRLSAKAWPSRYLLVRRFPAGWAVHALGLHVFYRPRRPMRLVEPPPERREIRN
jgi:hypothetical protein